MEGGAPSLWLGVNVGQADYDISYSAKHSAGRKPGGLRRATPPSAAKFGAAVRRQKTAVDLRLQEIFGLALRLETCQCPAPFPGP